MKVEPVTMIGSRSLPDSYVNILVSTSSMDYHPLHALKINLNHRVKILFTEMILFITRLVPTQNDVTDISKHSLQFKIQEL